MFPKFGMTPMQLFRFRLTYLRDICTISIYAGESGLGGDTFTALANQPTPGFLIEKSGISNSQDSIAQAFDCSLVLGGEIALQEPGKRYQISVGVVSRDPQQNGSPNVLRTRNFEVLGVDTLRDSAGGEGLQVVRLKSA